MVGGKNFNADSIRLFRRSRGLVSRISVDIGQGIMRFVASLTLGHLILDNTTVLVLLIATFAFFGSFIYISKTNDMKGALLSLLPGRRK